MCVGFWVLLFRPLIYGQPRFGQHLIDVGDVFSPRPKFSCKGFASVHRHSCSFYWYRSQSRHTLGHAFPILKEYFFLYMMYFLGKFVFCVSSLIYPKDWQHLDTHSCITCFIAGEISQTFNHLTKLAKSCTESQWHSFIPSHMRAYAGLLIIMMIDDHHVIVWECMIKWHNCCLVGFLSL